MPNHNGSSRRDMLRTGVVIAAGVAGVAMASTARAQDEKIAQELVQYQAQPKDGQQCNKCAQWVEPNACKIVVGVIAPTGYCVAYAPQEG